MLCTAGKFPEEFVPFRSILMYIFIVSPCRPRLWKQLCPYPIISTSVHFISALWVDNVLFGHGAIQYSLIILASLKNYKSIFFFYRLATQLIILFTLVFIAVITYNRSWEKLNCQFEKICFCFHRKFHCSRSGRHTFLSSVLI